MTASVISSLWRKTFRMVMTAGVVLLLVMSGLSGENGYSGASDLNWVILNKPGDPS